MNPHKGILHSLMRYKNIKKPIRYKKEAALILLRRLYATEDEIRNDIKQSCCEFLSCTEECDIAVASILQAHDDTSWVSDIIEDDIAAFSECETLPLSSIMQESIYACTTESLDHTRAVFVGSTTIACRGTTRACPDETTYYVFINNGVYKIINHRRVLKICCIAIAWALYIDMDKQSGHSNFDRLLTQIKPIETSKLDIITNCAYRVHDAILKTTINNYDDFKKFIYKQLFPIILVNLKSLYSHTASLYDRGTGDLIPTTPSSSGDDDIQCVICLSSLKENDNIKQMQCCNNKIHMHCHSQYLVTAEYPRCVCCRAPII